MYIGEINSEIFASQQHCLHFEHSWLPLKRFVYGKIGQFMEVYGPLWVLFFSYQNKLWNKNRNKLSQSKND